MNHMTFNEQNTVEEYVIELLTGNKLESNTKEDAARYSSLPKWKYISAEELDRATNEILVEQRLKNASWFTAPCPAKYF